MRTVLFILSLALSLNVAAKSKVDIAENIRMAAVVAGVDPDLAVAIATVESGLNPNAVGGLGEIGLFQLRPEYHKVIKGYPGHNILIAIAYLAELKKKFGPKYGDAWFVLYNWGPYNPPKYPKETKYYRKVMHELNRIRLKQMVAIN